MSAAMSAMSLGHFIRLVILASRSGGRVVPLREIGLLPAEEESLRSQLVHARDLAWSDLNVEGRVTWGALYLYAFARCAETEHQDTALFGPPLDAEQIEAVTAGRDLWIRREVGGAVRELSTLSSAVAQAEPELAPPRRPRARATTRVLVRAMPPALGRYRIAVRAEGRQRPGASLACDLVATESDIEVAIFDERGHRNAQFQLAADRPWQQVEFVTFCDHTKRARVELRPTAEIAGFRAVPLPGAFPTVPPLVIERAQADDGAAGIERFFELLAAHRIVSEEDAIRALGSPRAFRRFSLEFDAHVAKLPFRVRIEMGEGGKRYIREEDR